MNSFPTNPRELTPVQIASNDYVEEVAIEETVGMIGCGYVWHGWSLRNAFIAGAEWQKKQAASLEGLTK